MALPDKVGPYPVVRTLGEGGMGVVYEVRDPHLGRPLALKLVRALQSPNALDRFWREAEALGRLSHPGIVRIHLTGRSPRGPYLVQELVEGEPLDRQLLAGLPGPRRAAELVRDLADALAAVHAAGLLHRDLKPANVLVRADGRPVVIDFGLAWDAQAESLTKTGAALGTPAYMAPEQARGLKSGQLDARCDVYGLGAILYELLTGAPPFEGETRFEVFGKLLHTDPTWPAELRPGVPGDLDAVCRRAMAKEREGRYPTATALRDDLEHVLRGEPVEAARPASSVSSTARAFGRAVRRRWPAALLVVGLAGGGAAAALALRSGAARARAEEAAALQRALDELAAGLDADAGDRLLDQVRRALALADGLEGAGEARPLAASAAAARRRLDRALLLRAARPLEAAPAAPDLAALGSALALALATPAPGEPDAHAARGLILLVAGRPAEARAAFDEATRDAPADSHTSAVGQRRWRAAWAALAAGDDRTRLEAPDVGRALWLAAGAARAAEPADVTALARSHLERAAQAPARPRGEAAEAALVERWLELEGLLRRRAPADALQELLARVDPLAEPAGPDRVSAALQAEASLLQGELLLGLGRWLAAAEAFERHGRLAAGAGAPPSPLVPHPGGARPTTLVPPDLAALAGLARALAGGLDAGRAGAARDRLATRLTLAGLTPPEAPPPGAADGAQAADLLAAGRAELAAARALDGAPRAARLARARRGLALAAAGRTGERERGARSGVGPLEAAACAARTQVEALAGDLAAAGEALGRARELDPDGWATREAEVDLLLAAGRAGEVPAALEVALAALDRAGERAVPRALLAAELLRRARAALVAARCDVDALAALDLQGRQADRDRAPARKALHKELAAEARRLGRTALAAAADERLAALAASEAQLRARRRELQRTLTDRTLDDRRGRSGSLDLLVASPLDGQRYIDNHNAGGRFGAGGFDGLALAFELAPGPALAYTQSYGPDSVAPEMAADARASIAAFAEPGEGDPTLPLPCDPELRRAFGALYGLDVGVRLAPATLRACHEAARAAFRRAPWSLAAHVALARLQVASGDAASALDTLDRAADLPDAPSVRPWLTLHEALALAALRRPEAAAAALARLLEGGRPPSLRGQRLRDEPLLRADRDLPGTLYPWAEAAARALEAPPGSR